MDILVLLVGSLLEGPAAAVQEGDLSPGNVSAEEALDDVFIDEDQFPVVNDSDTSSVSVFDFAIACLRRQPPDKTAVVSQPCLSERIFVLLHCIFKVKSIVFAVRGGL